MAIKRQFVWTVIPAGRVVPIGGNAMALCSLLLTPRLLGPANHALTLKDFGMQAWPQRLAAVSFSALRGDSTVPVERVPYLGIDGKQIELSVPQQQSAWTTLFPPDTIVQPYQPSSYDNRQAVHFPASQAGAQISAAYAGSSRALAMVHRADSTALRASLRAVNDTWKQGLWPRDRADSRSPLRQAYDFYRRPEAGLRMAAADFHDRREKEFHSIVARLVDHPLLLCALGLLIDLAVPASALESPGPSTLRILPKWPDPDPDRPPGWAAATQDDHTPSTAYTLTGARFVPATITGPSAAPFALGMLALAGAGVAGEGSNVRFEIMPFDVDGAALRMVSAAASDNGQPLSDHPDDTGLPALRSAGFALIDVDRATEHTNRLQRARDRATTEGLLGSPLTADNLIAGYRVDIFDDHSRQWRSLCRRRVHYDIGDIHIGVDATDQPGQLDEGYVRVDSVTTGADADDNIYVHQAITRWVGWSLVASRPDRIPDPIVIPPQPFTVHQTHDPGSLPKLRFGRKYWMRVRLADLAGGGLQLDEPGSEEQQSHEFIHRRFDPIAAPELLPTRAYTDGEGRGQLVIRSDRDMDAGAYAAAHGYRADDLRYMFPPKAALDIAIQHGKFDDAIGSASAATVDEAFAKAIRADRDLADIPGVQRPDDGTNAGVYYIAPETGVELPWLPDPAAPLFALGVRSRPTDPKTGSEGTSTGFDKEGLHIQYRWRGEWPDYAPVGLRLVAAPANSDQPCAARIETTGATRTLTVELRRAEQATLDLVSCPALDDVANHGLAIWAGAKPSLSSDPITQRVYHGHIRTVTPPHTITVVHAVQRPLVDPSGAFVASRQEGETDAVLRTTDLVFDVASTGRIDVHGEWSDFNDVITDPPSPPTTKSFATHVGSYDVAHVSLDKALPTIKQTFGDTRRRRVTYSVTAISRFRDYFAKITSADPDACTVRKALGVSDVPSSARAPAPQLRYTMPAFEWSRDSSGGVHRSTRRGGGVRMFLERPWFVSGADEKLAVIVSTASGRQDLSVTGKDPIWTTDAPQSPLTENHIVAMGRANESLPEAGNVIAMLFPVIFDEQMNCWLSDIDLSPLAQTSYFPFVRLSLCRYQDHTSVDVPRLSTPVRTEPVQLFPQRDLTVTVTATQVTVVLNGLGPGGSTPNTVHTELQTANTAAAGDDTAIGPGGWTTIATGSGLLGAQLQLSLPAGGGQPLRVLVTETENYPAQNPAPGTATSRLIYADTVRLR